MINPLIRRIPRELKDEIGKFIALFLFLTTTIGFVSGFLVADDSMKQTYDQSFNKYNIENGNFTTYNKLDKETISSLEKENLKIYPLFYKELTEHKGNTFRIYKNRKTINLPCIMEGELPKKSKEIALDRLHAENNNIKIGDEIEFKNIKYKVSGFVALSDYSALFQSGREFMFNAKNFTVAVVTPKGFHRLNNKKLTYKYGWKFNQNNLSDIAQKNKSDDFKKKLAKKVIIKDFVPRQDNQAIVFAGNDMGHDKIMMETILYIVILVMAFAFSVTLKNTVEREASVIGTLRASGYSKIKLILHYMSMPVIIMMISAIIGNIMGYTVMKETVAALYYHSYSLTRYETYFNLDALVMTTIVPILIVIVINLLALIKAFRVTPLNFLRHELKGNRIHKAMKLPNWHILRRFRFRVISQNKGVYITMFIGVFLASVMLIFGSLLSPLLDHYREDVNNYKMAEYQYILKFPMAVKSKSAEKYSITQLENKKEEPINIMGIKDDSKYVDFDENITLGELKKNEVVVSSGYMEKYNLKVGDTIKLKEKYKDKSYKFKVVGSRVYPSSFTVYMPLKNFNKVFEFKKGFFNGYFSDKELKSLDEGVIASIITEKELNALADQLNDSMGDMFILFAGFSWFMYILIMYLLSKLIVEKNISSISMLKILGYSNKEAGLIYNRATATVVVLSLVLTLPIARLMTKVIYFQMMKDFNGWLPYYMSPKVDISVLLSGLICFIVVYAIEQRKIKNISLGTALKTME